MYYRKSFLADTSQDQRATVDFRGPSHHAYDRLRAIKSPTPTFPPLLLYHTSFVFSKKVWRISDVQSAVQKLHVNKRIASLPRLPPKPKPRWLWIWSRGAKEVACCACELTTSKIGKRSHDEGRLWKVVQIQRSTSDVSAVQHHPNHGTARSAFSC